jgi:hypothetical protein
MRNVAILLALAAGAMAPPPYEPGGEGWGGFAVDVAEAPLADLEGEEALPFGIGAGEDAARFSVTYKGELIGIDIGRILLNASVGERGYELRYDMQQTGIARFFSDGEARTRAAGLFGDGPDPIAASYYHNHDYEAEDDQQRVELARAPGERRLRLWSLPAYTFHDPVSEGQALGATDPLGALIALGFPEAQPGRSPCERTAKVFDGRRRFDLFLAPDGVERVKAGGSGRFEGEAHRCRLTMRKVGGYRSGDRDEVEGDVWVYLAPVPEALRTDRFAYFPAKVKAKRGILSATLEAKDPTITGPDGVAVNLGRR